jgi:HTH-type transcriptional regulator / antitoxin HigA
VKIAPIRNDMGHKKSLNRAAELASKSDQESLDELEVLQAVIDQWERAQYQMPAPTPLDAIRFRMEQSGLKPRDLEPYIGSRARVSEVLTGKRPLSIDMIRALHQHLGIPAASLISSTPVENVGQAAAPSAAALKKLREIGGMMARETFDAFIGRALGQKHAEALLRKTRTERVNAKTDDAALNAWCAAVMLHADKVPIASTQRKGSVEEFARRLAKFSAQPTGPLKAQRELARAGIILIALEHLPGTYLDGAAMRRHDGAPVIALTLRHDRIDNFWFTLLHEFCHVSKHLKEDWSVIIDDLELKGSDEIESEADAFAQEALVPAAIWNTTADSEMQMDDVVRIAALAGVHPAIVAGRWQREHNDYRRFSKVLGRGEVRVQFLPTGTGDR